MYTTQKKLVSAPALFNAAQIACLTKKLLPISEVDISELNNFFVPYVEYDEFPQLRLSDALYALADFLRNEDRAYRYVCCASLAACFEVSLEQDFYESFLQGRNKPWDILDALASYIS